jgi:hypothetical protein
MAAQWQRGPVARRPTSWCVAVRARVHDEHAADALAVADRCDVQLACLGAQANYAPATSIGIRSPGCIPLCRTHIGQTHAGKGFVVAVPPGISGGAKIVAQHPQVRDPVVCRLGWIHGSPIGRAYPGSSRRPSPAARVYERKLGFPVSTW